MIKKLLVTLTMVVAAGCVFIPGMASAATNSAISKFVDEPVANPADPTQNSNSFNSLDGMGSADSPDSTIQPSNDNSSDDSVMGSGDDNSINPGDDSTPPDDDTNE